MHVPGVPERERLVRRLRSQFPYIQVIRDLEMAGPWATALKAMRRIAPGATHHMVIQDHAYMPDGAPDALIRAISARPASFIVPYAIRSELAAYPGCWAQMRGAWGTAAAAPVELWDEYRRWAMEWTAQSPSKNDDRRLEAWMAATGRVASVTIPSLVTHTGVTSLLGHPRHRTRRATVLFGDVPEPDWAGDLADGPMLRGASLDDLSREIDPDKVELWREEVRRARAQV